MSLIHEAIIKTMDEVGAIGKDSKNTTQGFMFRGIDAVMNALHPAMVKNGIFCVPEVLEQIREERTNAKGTTLLYSVCKVKYTFYASDGSSVEAVVIGEGMDTGDKATNKAMSIAFKYACFQVFCIPTEEMKEPDADGHEVQPKEAPATTDKMSEAQRKAIYAICSKRNINVEKLYAQHKTTESEASKAVATQILMRLNNDN